MTTAREAKIQQTSNSVWDGIGFKAYRLDANSLILRNSTGHTATISGYTLQNGTFVSHGTQISVEANIGPDCCILNSVIGPEVILGAHVFIGRRSVILDGAIIGQNSSLGEEAKISGGVYGNGIRIGDGYRGSGLVKVGNNVTITEGCSLNGKISVGENSKIGAHSALEDGELGNNAIVGEHVIGSDGFHVPANTTIPDGFEIIGFREIKGNKLGFRLVPPPYG